MFDVPSGFYRKGEKSDYKGYGYLNIKIDF